MGVVAIQSIFHPYPIYAPVQTCTQTYTRTYTHSSLSTISLHACNTYEMNVFLFPDRILKFRRLAQLAPMVGKYQRYPSQIPTVPPLTSVTMYNYHPRLLAKSNIEKQYFSHCVNDVSNGSPSRIRRVLRISFGMTILPRSSTRLTMPVAFIVSSPLKRVTRVWSGSSICRKRGIM